MFAKKFFSTTKPWSFISSSFSNFFSFLNSSSSDGPEPEYDQIPQKIEFNFFQIHSQTSKELLNSYENWLGKMNFSHSMIEKNPCQIVLTRGSIFGNVLRYFDKRRNRLENRTVSIQYAANNPIEDRIIINQIHDIQGYLLNIFDGHGGWQLAEYAMDTLPMKFQKYLSNSKEISQEMGFSFDQIIIEAFLKTYDSIENGFLKIARKAKSLGSLKTGNVGSSALSVFIHGNKLYVANSGDSKGFLCSLKEDGGVRCLKINKKIKNPLLVEEQKLALVLEKDDKNPKFYLKNILKPTRAFGDYCLKYTEFYEEKNEKFNGPSLTHQPEIKVLELNENDRFLILGSNGVWNNINRKSLEKILITNFENIFTIAENIFNSSLEKICEKTGIEKEELMSMAMGKERRKYHDDLSLMVVDLKNQYK